MPPGDDGLPPITHRFVDVGGLRMHVAEAGSGPLVLLLHGFPESWYSWRHQLTALASAGLHVVAPDQRGYCQTGPPRGPSGPPGPSTPRSPGGPGGPGAASDPDGHGGPGDPAGAADYTILHLTGDVIGLMDALGEDEAVVAGHDWGAPVAWHAALLRPDRIRGVAGLSVPYTPRGSVPPVAALREAAGEGFYMIYFQQPGVAEAELGRDLTATFRRVLSSGSGGAPGGTTGTGRPDRTAPRLPVVPPGGGFLDLCPEPGALPVWLTSEDIAAYAEQYAESGFAGPLNWYRNLDRNWELTAAWHRAKVTVPALYVAGDRDLVLSFPGARQRLPRLRDYAPRLRDPILLSGCGHWTQQERPEEVSDALISFIRELG